MPELLELPELRDRLSRTKAFGANGSVSNIGIFPDGVTKMRRELRAFEPDVVHVHEPPAGPLSWDACSYPGAPVVATFHAYSTKPLLNHVATLAGDAPQAQPALRPDRGLRGGGVDRAALVRRHTTTMIPNGVDIDAAPAGPKPPADELRLIFVGRPEERKGLPVLLTAFEALVEHEDARLIVIGAERAEVGRYLSEPETLARIEALGRVERRRALAPAARGRPALRALAGRRELRHGADRGVRGRDAGAGLEHRRLRRRGQRRPRRDPRPARRPAAARRGAAGAERLSRAARAHGRSRPANLPSATPGRGSPARSRPSTSARSRCPGRDDRRPGRASQRRSARARPTASRPFGRGACPRSTPSPPAAADRHRTARRVGLGVAAADRPRAHLHRRPAGRRRPAW